MEEKRQKAHEWRERRESILLLLLTLLTFVCRHPPSKIRFHPAKTSSTSNAPTLSLSLSLSLSVSPPLLYLSPSLQSFFYHLSAAPMLLTFCWPNHTWTLKVFIWFWFCSWFIECILHSLFYTLLLSLSRPFLSISISLLPYLYMSRLRSLDLKKKGNSVAWPRSLHSRTLHARAQARGSGWGPMHRHTRGAGHTH